MTSFLLLLLLCHCTSLRSGFRLTQRFSYAVSCSSAGDKAERNVTSYKQEDLMLKASKNSGGKGPEYRVLIPEGMNPTLSPAEKKVAERLEGLKAEDPKKTDLELLKEELRRVIETMSKNEPL